MFAMCRTRGLTGNRANQAQFTCAALLLGTTTVFYVLSYITQSCDLLSAFNIYYNCLPDTQQWSSMNIVMTVILTVNVRSLRHLSASEADRSLSALRL